MSAALDTVDHDILLQKLNCTYGIRGDALNCITSYLTGRTKSVKIDGFTSAETLVSHGVPQGSELGPMLFILHTGELESIVRAHGLLPYSYADDNYCIYSRISREILGKIICKSLGGRFIPGARNQTKKNSA